ncbi:DUF4355 domain-containing protein [Streptomyces naphthomycinicus]|uniref:DUF4355 domain-containing protein n=1 Tax=Streptomyces naphthomycinicus TaxID=2872625 RepID=UPI001CEC3434|nr:DUF4355 domain-containing protein [Streptomyces sp. TML10]
MQLVTDGTRTVAGATGVSTLAGIGVTLLGVLTADLPMVVGGTCLTITALIVLALLLVYRWITDTREERRVLAAMQRTAQSERDQCFAARVATESERGRLLQEVRAEQRRMASTLAREREAMRAEFEEQKAQLIVETMEATVRMFHNGKFAPAAAPTTGRLIHFPKQGEPAPAPATGRTRPREHGEVAP